MLCGGARWPRDHCALSWIGKVKQHWSVIGWVSKMYYLELLRASEGTLIPAAFAVACSH
jgi:hypothetical protein